MKTYGPIQVIPAGLLGLLQLKNIGKNPNLMQDEVSPGIDLGKWWLETLAAEATETYTSTYIGGTNGPGMNGVGNTLISPDTEWWWVKNYTVETAAVAAGTNIRFKPAYLSPRFGVFRPYLLNDDAVTASVVGERVICGARDFWMPPGAQLGTWVEFISGTSNLVLNAHITYTALPI